MHQSIRALHKYICMLKCWVYHSLSIPPLSDNYISLAFRVGYYFKPYTKSRIVQPQEEAELHVLKGDFFSPSFLFPPLFPGLDLCQIVVLSLSSLLKMIEKQLK